MEKTTTTAQPVCAQESLALLNCVASVPYDRDRCLALVDALRECIVRKVLFTCGPASPYFLSPAPFLKHHPQLYCLSAFL
jgi:hypothetical protein